MHFINKIKLACIMWQNSITLYYYYYQQRSHIFSNNSQTAVFKKQTSCYIPVTYYITYYIPVHRYIAVHQVFDRNFIKTLIFRCLRKCIAKVRNLFLISEDYLLIFVTRAFHMKSVIIPQRKQCWRCYGNRRQIVLQLIDDFNFNVNAFGRKQKYFFIKHQRYLLACNSHTGVVTFFSVLIFRKFVFLNILNKINFISKLW